MIGSREDTKISANALAGALKDYLGDLAVVEENAELPGKIRAIRITPTDSFHAEALKAELDELLPSALRASGNKNQTIILHQYLTPRAVEKALDDIAHAQRPVFVTLTDDTPDVILMSNAQEIAPGATYRQRIRAQNAQRQAGKQESLIGRWITKQLGPHETSDEHYIFNSQTLPDPDVSPMLAYLIEVVNPIEEGGKLCFPRVRFEQAIRETDNYWHQAIQMLEEEAIAAASDAGKQR